VLFFVVHSALGGYVAKGLDFQKGNAYRENTEKFYTNIY